MIDEQYVSMGWDSGVWEVRAFGSGRFVRFAPCTVVNVCLPVGREISEQYIMNEYASTNMLRCRFIVEISFDVLSSVTCHSGSASTFFPVRR